MPNYNETNVSGIAWQRAYQIQINNRVNQMPNIIFYEEEAIDLPSGPITKHIGQLVENFTDPLKEFNLIHPLTGDVIGIAKYQDFQVLLYSLYMNLVNARDNPPVVVPTPEEPQP